MLRVIFNSTKPIWNWLHKSFLTVVLYLGVYPLRPTLKSFRFRLMRA